MGLPMEGGPDYIITRARDDVTVPWVRPIAGFLIGLWLLFVLGPYVFADSMSTAVFGRWSVIALVALLVIFGLPALRSRERGGAVVGLLVVAAAITALVWLATA